MPFSPDEYKIELTPLDRLIANLRGPEPAWWNFATCRRCAMHSAVEIGIGEYEEPCHIAEKLGIPPAVAYAVFGYDTSPANCMNPRNWQDDIRPRHVAAALEHYKLTGEAKSPFEFVAETRAP